MPSTKSDIIQRLEREILPLQGFKPPRSVGALDFGLGSMNAAFPNGEFPTGAIHEVLSTGPENAAASVGFVGGLIGTLMRNGGAVLWIGARQKIFPVALKVFGIEPDRIVFVELRHQKYMLWVMEEALKCEGLAAVVGEIPEIGFTASRRLQLAVEQSRVTGFILRHQTRGLLTNVMGNVPGNVAANVTGNVPGNVIANVTGNVPGNACVARWRVTPLASQPEAGLPGVGFPRWNVELLKIRNGRPGAWPLEWAAGRFRTVPQSMVAGVTGALPMVAGVAEPLPMTAKLLEQKRKAG
jgi:protein ImuA